ncbi:uncharacterized protein [Rutidosis leptorrhynchoides]|uniref:uncharacterized protein n=1 Tax=Rutidosis leptorrhynchoides TaxID=125765 RepID=UPI003A9A3FE0
MRLLKKPLRKLMWTKDNVHANVIKFREDLDRIQKLLDAHPYSQEIRDEEIKTLKAYNDALWVEERFLRQKAKVEWLKLGNGNTSYFHKVVKAKNNRSHINAVINNDDVLVEGNELPNGQMDIPILSLKKLRILLEKRCKPNLGLMSLLVEIGHEVLPALDHKLCFSKFEPKSLSISDLGYWGLIAALRRIRVKDWLCSHGGGLGKTLLWIMKCVTSTSFSISINGNLHGHIKGMRGWRQGDPLSPYIFIMVMKILTHLIRRNIQRTENYNFHPKCETQDIVNVCFADDLFLFSHASQGSVKVIADALEDLKNYSALVSSVLKNLAFFSNVTSSMKHDILSLMPFSEGLLMCKI